MVRSPRCPVLIEVARGVPRLRGRSLALSSVAKCSIAVVIMPRYCGDFLASTLIEGCLLYNSRNKTTVGGGLGSVTRDNWGKYYLSHCLVTSRDRYHRL